VPLRFEQLEFGQPQYLWLLAVPAVLLLLWVWRFVSRRADARALRRHRVVPVRERFALAGDLPFWLFLLPAMACVIVALARPHGPAQQIRTGGIDMVILADGSASMRVRDIPGGDRWQHSMNFVRLVAESLDWEEDRLALTVFARIAAPQVRLTRDPNTFFFFLDHLDQTPPFRIEDNTTWDTNLELAVYWGLRLMERDEELHGKSVNGKMFVLLTDGQAWSGEVANSLRLAARRRVPIYAVGVGSLAGGRLPPPPPEPGTGRGGVQEASAAPAEPPLTSRLDRESLQRIATATGGQYFELDRDNDRRVANAVVDAGRRLAPTLGVEETAEELYWWFLAAAAGFLLAGLLFLRNRTELALHLAGTAAVFVVVSRLLQ
jgi:Ca-activated chloride channel family protein